MRLQCPRVPPFVFPDDEASRKALKLAPPRASERIVGVIRAQQSVLRCAALAILAALALACAPALCAQTPNPTSAANPFFGSVTARPVSDEALKLSLDEAITLGLKNNLGLKEAENSEKSLQGQKTRPCSTFYPPSR